MNIRVRPTTNTAEMFALVAEHFNENELKFVLNGNAVSIRGTVEMAGFEDGDVIDVYRTQRDGKHTSTPHQNLRCLLSFLSFPSGVFQQSTHSSP